MTKLFKWLKIIQLILAGILGALLLTSSLLDIMGVIDKETHDAWYKLDTQLMTYATALFSLFMFSHALFFWVIPWLKKYGSILFSRLFTFKEKIAIIKASKKGGMD
jgi:hypothetical protein